MLLFLSHFYGKIISQAEKSFCCEFFVKISLRENGVFMKKSKTYKQKRPFRQRVAAFMYGRNGFDELCAFIWILCLVLLAVNLIFTSVIISAVETALMVYTIFRSMSRNLYKRQKENAAFMKMRSKFTGFFKILQNKWRDRKTHVYRKCKICRNVLRLPKVKGKHTVNCPCCHNRFDIKI